MQTFSSPPVHHAHQTRLMRTSSDDDDDDDDDEREREREGDDASVVFVVLIFGGISNAH